jgi:hypothetical protein
VLLRPVNDATFADDARMLLVMRTDAESQWIAVVAGTNEGPGLKSIIAFECKRLVSKIGKTVDCNLEVQAETTVVYSERSAHASNEGEMKPAH